MMDKTLWQKIASFWTVLRSAEEKENTARTVDAMFQSSLDSRQEERSLAALLLGSIDEEDDDDGY